jgi:ATP-dependent DNA helicase
LVKQKVVEPQDEEEPVEDKKKGRGKKRTTNSKPQYNDVSADFIYYSLLC